MIYNGFETDNNLRFVSCPRCGNVEFSDKAAFCKICGLPVYNECGGEIAGADPYGNIIRVDVHRCLGNARYCEICGRATMLFSQKLLKPYNEILSQGLDDEDLVDTFND